MEFKGTKGEWRADSFSGVWLNSDYMICDCECDRQIDNESEREANAKLISCAPEMLKQLIFLIEAVEHEDIIVKENIDNDGQESLFCKLYTEIIATVKKATS